MDTTNYTSGASVALPGGSENNMKPSAKTMGTALGGAILGSGVPFVIGKINNGLNSSDEESTVADNASDTTAIWSDGNISVATGISDEMSFNEAFAAARAEVGAGGAFEWRGNVYGTYYAEEWNSMTPAEKADYNNHFNWNHIDSTHETASATSGVSDDIEVISVNHPTSGHANAGMGGDVVDVVSAEPEIEVLGVVHDMSTGANLGGMTVDGQDVFLIDVDGDLEFDYMASDLNHNEVLDEGEVVDIHGQGMTVNDLGGISEITESLTGEDPLPDYLADNTYEI